MKGFLKKYLISGILVLVPIVATVWVVKTLILWVDGLLFSFLPQSLRPETLIGFNIPGLGLLMTFVIILIAGIVTRLYIGKKLVQAGEAIVSRLPVGRAVYKATKQVLQTTFSGAGQKTKSAVLVEFPVGTHMIGFVTGKWNRPTKDGKKYVTVFVPTTPTPTNGFLFIVPETAITPTDMTAEEAWRLLISGGLLSEEKETPVQ